jgi:hypothetical protein
MGNKREPNDFPEPQSPSQPGPTNENPNEDKADGNQSTVQPGGAGDSTGTTGGQTTGDGATSNAPAGPTQ